MKLPKRTPQPALKTRVEKLVVSLQREMALNENMLTGATAHNDAMGAANIQGRMNAIQHVLDVLHVMLVDWPHKDVRKTVGARVESLIRYCNEHGEVPSIEAPGEPSEARQERITYKRLSSQVAMLLKNLPEED